MTDLTIKDFEKRYGMGLERIYSLTEVHSEIKNVAISVYFYDILWDKQSTWFWIFKNETYIGNPVSFPCNISIEDKQLIAKDMVQELLEKTYSIPNHVNIWTKITNKWDAIYGDKSLNYKKYIAGRTISSMNRFMHACGDNREIIEEVLSYAKKHRANQHKDLFR